MSRKTPLVASPRPVLESIASAPGADPEPADAARVAGMFGALGHEVRVTILRLLLASHPDGRVVGDLQDELAIPGSTLSHHLDSMLQEGLVTKTREGRFLRYRADAEGLRELLDFLYAECCGRRSVIEINPALRPRC